MTVNARKALASSRCGLVYAQETAKLEFASDLHSLMEKQGINQRQLAVGMGKSEASVSKALRGDANLTIETMVELAHHCSGRLHFKLTRANSALQWIEVLDGHRQRDHRPAWVALQRRQATGRCEQLPGEAPNVAAA